MKGFALSGATIMLVGGLLLWFNPARALKMLRVNYGGPITPSIWYRIGGVVLLLMALVLFIIMFVSE